MLDELFSKRVLAYIGILLIPLSFLLELYSGYGVYVGCGYTLAVLLTFYHNTRYITIVVTISAILMLLYSVLYLHDSEPFYAVTVNSMLSLTAVTLSSFFILYIKGLQRKAEEYNKQVSSLFSHATEGVILTNAKGEIILVNPFAEDLFGYAKNELVGRRIEMLLPDNIRDKHEHYRDNFHANPHSRSMGAGRDLHGRKRDGSVFPVEVSLSHYTVGGESFVIAFIIDITIRKKDEEALRNKTRELETVTTEMRRLNSMLEQKVEDRTMMLRETLAQLERSKDEIAFALEKEKELSDLKSRFVSTVSHEFRTPLATILSSSALIAKYPTGDDNEKRLRHTARIRESVKHMNGMLEDLLSLGKLEEGLVAVNTSTFVLEPFISEFVSDMREIAKEGQEIKYEVQCDGTVTTDKRLLKNVLINLVSNAVKFSPEHSVVEIKAACENGTLVVSVKDSGIGISEEDQQHLFERFFRARNALNIQGTGLGLHIVSKYLELLHGDIALSSKLGEGTTFTITIQQT